MLTLPWVVLIAPMSTTWKIPRILSALHLDGIYFGPSCFQSRAKSLLLHLCSAVLPPVLCLTSATHVTSPCHT